MASSADIAARVSVTVHEGIAHVRLTRPDKRNALDDAMFQAIAQAGERVKHDTSVRAVVLSGEGASFCAGLDFGGFQAMGSGGNLEMVAISLSGNGRCGCKEKGPRTFNLGHVD